MSVSDKSDFKNVGGTLGWEPLYIPGLSNSRPVVPNTNKQPYLGV